MGKETFFLLTLEVFRVETLFADWDGCLYREIVEIEPTNRKFYIAFRETREGMLKEKRDLTLKALMRKVKTDG